MRQAIKSAMIQQMHHIGKNVIHAQYQFDEKLKIHRETNVPPKEYFMELGYDPDHDS